MLRVLFIGDVIGGIGRVTLSKLLPELIKKNDVDFTIANGENSAGGFGISPKIADEIFGMGVDVITTGNHVWDKKDILPYLTANERIIRPANYPESVEGKGSVVVETKKGTVAVLQLMGRIFMNPIDCPFKVGKAEIKKLKSKTDIIIIDFHAEATSEKVALGWYLDGHASALIGTHTHVTTADERIFPNGMAYITDVGMTGPELSVIGIKPEHVVAKFLTMTPKKFEVATGSSMLNAVLIDIDIQTGKADMIKRLQAKGDFSV